MTDTFFLDFVEISTKKVSEYFKDLLNYSRLPLLSHKLKELFVCLGCVFPTTTPTTVIYLCSEDSLAQSEAQQGREGGL